MMTLKASGGADSQSLLNWNMMMAVGKRFRDNSTPVTYLYIPSNDLRKYVKAHEVFPGTWNHQENSVLAGAELYLLK